MARLVKTATALLAAALLAGPLGADWLVLNDGTRLETRGGWEERGRLVVFKTTDGTLSSLRLDAIDLEASRQATEEAAKPPAPPAKPPAAEPKKAVFVLTDADVAHRPDSVDEGGDESAPTAGPGGERLVVTDWQESPLPDESGTLITGTLRNVSTEATTRIQLTVLVYDATGELLATTNAMLSAQALMPNQQARFQVEFSGIYTIAAVSFRPSSLALDTGSSAPATESEAEAGEPGGDDGPEPGGEPTDESPGSAS